MLKSDHQQTTKQHLYDGEKKENSVNKSVNSFKDQRNMLTCRHVKVRRVEGVFLLPGGTPLPPAPALPWQQRATDEVLQRVNTNTPHHRSYSINTANALPQPYLETYGLFLTAERKPALMLNSRIILGGKNGDPFKISKLQRRRYQESPPPSLNTHHSRNFPSCALFLSPRSR